MTTALCVAVIVASYFIGYFIFRINDSSSHTVAVAEPEKNVVYLMDHKTMADIDYKLRQRANLLEQIDEIDNSIAYIVHQFGRNEEIDLNKLNGIIEEQRKLNNWK